jgi:hypothetical protein
MLWRKDQVTASRPTSSELLRMKTKLDFTELCQYGTGSNVQLQIRTFQNVQDILLSSSSSSTVPAHTNSAINI